AADVRVEQINRLEALAPYLGIEVDAARRQSPLPQDDQHALRRQVQVGRELIRIPAEQEVAAVGVDRAEQALRGGVGQLVHHRVPRQRRVVGLHVQLEMIRQAVAAQEGDHGGGVEVVLMDRRLLRLRLDQELAGETDLLLVI